MATWGRFPVAILRVLATGKRPRAATGVSQEYLRMYELKPVTPRVQKMRGKYRNTKPRICTARYRLVTDFYRENPRLTGILRRAKNLKYVCENIPVRIYEDEVIVGEQGSSYRACALYPETGIAWIRDEIDTLPTRYLDPYDISEEDKKYILETLDFWADHAHGVYADAYVPDFLAAHEGNGVTTFRTKGGHLAPVGHFCANHQKAIHKGFGAVKKEADAKVRELEAQGLPGNTIDSYNFYRAVSIACDAVMILAKRYAREARRQMEACAEPERRAELAMMADSLDHIMEEPCRTFYDGLQCLFLYQTVLALDGNLHGLSFGRIDQYLIDLYEKDLEAKRITPEYAQELLDLFYLKVAEVNKVVGLIPTESGPGYTSGQLMTLGGVDKDGNDASNDVTYMMLQSAGRLVLHDPPQALRIHAGTPDELWEAALRTTKIAGGVPSLENDEVIIPALMKRGLSLESARNYCLIGCVEPSGCGDEWPACGGPGAESYFNLANALCLALNDGFNPMPSRSGAPRKERVGLPTGYLKDMTSMDQVWDAFRRQVEFFVNLHCACANSYEYTTRDVLPLPVVSAMIDGCMESGKDVMYGGAKYNSTGIAGIALGNAADSLQMIRHLVFEEKICTAAELQEALEKNWEGYESLHHYIKTRAPHYGNNDPEADRYVHPVTEMFAKAVYSHTGPRGNHFAPGMYPVTTNIFFGKMTPATPDGRFKGEPLADGISPVQGKDKGGPTALLSSVLHFDNQTDYSNGTLLNMKFDPGSVRTEEDIRKLAMLVRTYFASGGMEMQINVVDSATMRKAQEKPEEYRDLVVRVAGFSAYFVELAPAGQKDLISRTELNL